MILTVSFANQEVTNKSYEQMVNTMQNDCEVLFWDNHYPGTNGKQVADWYGFKYFSAGKNVGLYEGFDQLIKQLPRSCTKFVGYDGDNFPMQNNWHNALLDTIGGEYVHSTLKNSISWREMDERGFDRYEVNGYRVRITKSAVTNTCSAYSRAFLEECGGLWGSKPLYGGNEIEMWPKYEGKKWIFLEDFEDKWEVTKPLHDWQYEQFKLLYAHAGVEMNFDEYLAYNPERNDDLAKQLFG